MLAVVNDEQQLLCAQIIRQHGDQRHARRFAQIKYPRDRLRHERGIVQCSKVNPPHAVLEALLRREFGRHLKREARFATTAYAGTSQQSRGGEQSLDLHHLVLPPDKTGEQDGQVVARRCFGLREFSVANALVQRGRFARWLDVQLLFQQTPTGLVLRERGAALPGARQQQHQLAMAFLVPRFQVEQPARVGNAGGIARASLRDRIREQARQRVDSQFPQPRALRRHPGFKFGAVVEEHAVEEIAAAKRDGGLEIGECGAREICNPFELLDVNPVGRLRIKGDRLWGWDEDRGLGGDAPGNVPERAREIVARLRFVPIAPEQASEFGARLRRACDGKVNQQRGVLVAFQDDRLAVPLGVQPAEQAQAQTCARLCGWLDSLPRHCRTPLEVTTYFTT